LTRSPFDSRTGRDLFGTPGKFEGFLVAFDTFKNTEMMSTHKDVMLLSNSNRDNIDPAAPLAEYNYHYSKGVMILAYWTMRRLASLLTVRRMKSPCPLTTRTPACSWIASLTSCRHLRAGAEALHTLRRVRALSLGHGIRAEARPDAAAASADDLQLVEQQVRTLDSGGSILQLLQLYASDTERRLNHLHHAIGHELSFMHTRWNR